MELTKDVDEDMSSTLDVDAESELLGMANMTTAMNSAIHRGKIGGNFLFHDRQFIWHSTLYRMLVVSFNSRHQETHGVRLDVATENDSTLANTCCTCATNMGLAKAKM